MFLKALSREKLEDKVLRQDRGACKKIGPAGIGERAIYLGGFFTDRSAYVPMARVRRVYKRIAMSKGGYTGKGLFASIPYLVVEYDDTEEWQCRFRQEQLVDLFLEEIGRRFPHIPLHSREAERRMQAAEEAERKRYREKLSEEALNTLKQLRNAEEFLELRPELYHGLSGSAKTKRMVGYTNPFYRHLQYLIFMGGIFALLIGVLALRQGQVFSVYFVLFGFALLFLLIAARVRPTGVRNKKEAEQEWSDAIRKMECYLKERGAAHGIFPLPPQYAHPDALRRMVRVIREGRAETAEEALAVLKRDLKALNSSVAVSQQEYDEIVAIKPMFLCMDYR